jgi:hypothetical protein
MVGLGGCGRDARFAGQNVRDVEVKPITAYGKTLDAEASPKDVVYVLLKAVVDDYNAPNAAARDAALDTQLAVSAPVWIKRLLQRPKQPLPEDRLREGMFNVVRHWAPTLGFYRKDFEADYETLAKRMFVTQRAERGDEPAFAEVFLNVDHPDPENNANSGAVARFSLVKDKGLWRIYLVSWETGMRNWEDKFLRRAQEPEHPDQAEPSNP